MAQRKRASERAMEYADILLMQDPRYVAVVNAAGERCWLRVHGDAVAELSAGMLSGYIGADWTGRTPDDSREGSRFCAAGEWHGTRDAVKLEDCSRSRVYPCYHDVRMNLGFSGGVDHFAVPTVSK